MLSNHNNYGCESGNRNLNHSFRLWLAFYIKEQTEKSHRPLNNILSLISRIEQAMRQLFKGVVKIYILQLQG
jgi:hypothetical protein